MSNDIAVAFSNSPRCLVVAPAGCGKTELIADAVKVSCAGRELILTHTHAGVRALRDRLFNKQVTPQKYVLDTIDSFAVHLAAAYPILGGKSFPQDAIPDWVEARKAACRVLESKPIQQALKNSFGGVLVDEYQDCTESQHALILKIADLLPCRIVGDPLQGIFGFNRTDELPNWEKVVLESFPKLAELCEPHRWVKANPELGRWLLELRSVIENGSEVDITAQINGLRRIVVANDVQRSSSGIAECHRLANTSDSVVGLWKRREQCYSFGKKLNGRYGCVEPVDCEELVDWVEVIDNASGALRASKLLEFARECTSNLGATLGKAFRGSLAKGVIPRITQRGEAARAKSMLVNVSRTQDTRLCAGALREMIGLSGVVTHRRELFGEMVRTLEGHDAKSGRSLKDTALQNQSRQRHFGRLLPNRALATTLLVKGLEFDHAIVFDPEGYDARNLYVALTRARKTLTLLSSKGTITVRSRG